MAQEDWLADGNYWHRREEVAGGVHRHRWRLLSNPHLDKAERAKIYATWSGAASRLRALAVRLRSAGIEPTGPAPLSQ